MDKRWIEGTINARRSKREVVTKKGIGVTSYDYVDDFGTAAEAIAQAAEEDNADALAQLSLAWHAVEGGHLATIADLRAQVAVMAGALRKLVNESDEGPLDSGQGDGPVYRASWLEALEDARQAVSAAPKVLYHAQIKAGERLDLNYHVPIETDQDLDVFIVATLNALSEGET